MIEPAKVEATAREMEARQQAAKSGKPRLTRQLALLSMKNVINGAKLDSISTPLRFHAVLNSADKSALHT